MLLLLTAYKISLNARLHIFVFKHKPGKGASENKFCFFMNHKDHDGVVPIMVTNPTGSGGRASTQMPNQQHMRHEKARMMFAIELN